MTYPLWLIWNPAAGEDGPDQGRLVSARDPQSAAEEWAYQYDRYSSDFELVKNEDHRELIHICLSSDPTEVFTFEVYGVVSYEYHASRIEP